MQMFKQRSMQIGFIFALLLAPLAATQAQASSSFFTSAGCASCHSAPVVATCNGCHAHGAHSNSTKNTINISGTTDKASYVPGETVSVTIAGGYRTGWVRAVLYDQNQVELARSTGNASGMGSATTLPAVLNAPAPSTPGTYSWRVAWYGHSNDKSGALFGANWTPDSTNPGHGQEIVATNSFTVVAPADVTAPTVNAFTLPATSSSRTVSVSSFTATDNVAVSGYLVTTSAIQPLATASGWSASVPASVTASSDGSITFYAWAKDAAGNVSSARSAVVVITTVDIAKPLLNVSTLSNGAITNNQVLNISGRSWDDVALDTLTFNGNKVWQYGDGSFSLVLALLEGDNAINFVAADKAGNQVSIARTIIYQPLAPPVTITSPVDNLATAQQMIDITGTVEANSTVTITVNGKNAQVATLSGNVFTATVYLFNGINTIAVQSVNPTGSVSNAKRTVRYSPWKPTLAITAPNQDVIVDSPTVTLEGSVAENLSAVTSVKIVVDGQVYSPVLAANGTFSQQLILSKEQRYAIFVKATDASGQFVFTTRNVIYKASPAVQ